MCAIWLCVEIILFEPSCLSFCVISGVLFDFIDGFFEGQLTVEMGKKFGVADRLQGVQMSKRVQFTRLFEQTFAHHYIDAAIYSVI